LFGHSKDFVELTSWLPHTLRLGRQVLEGPWSSGKRPIASVQPFESQTRIASRFHTMQQSQPVDNHQSVKNYHTLRGVGPTYMAISGIERLDRHFFSFDTRSRMSVQISNLSWET
jgi:hypothetical protein